MTGRRLSLLFVTRLPPSPPRFGAQVRIHGLMTALAERHDVTGVSLLSSTDDAEAATRAMSAYCREVVLVPAAPGGSGAAKRALQLRSLASPRSYEHLLHAVPALQAALDGLLSRRRFDAVDVEFPFMTGLRLDRAPPGELPPRTVLGEHNVEWDLLRQVAERETGLLRRVYGAANWRKLRREEEAAWRRYDGVTVCSTQDLERLRVAAPAARAAVIPNAADVDFYRPRPDDPPPRPDTLVFFGSQGYGPNVDGIAWFLDRIWPRVLAQRPQARLEILGPGAPPALLARQGPQIEVAGFVEDLRPRLARAAAVIAPLRMGGGTRLKILEAMAMARPVVSTTIGAEGIEAADGEELLLADGEAPFADAVCRVLGDPSLARRLGAAGRELAERRYSWRAAAGRLEAFVQALLAPPPAG